MTETLKKFIDPVHLYLNGEITASNLVDLILVLWDVEEDNLEDSKDEYTIADELMTACDFFEENDMIRKDCSQYTDEIQLRKKLTEILNKINN